MIPERNGFLLPQGKKKGKHFQFFPKALQTRGRLRKSFQYKNPLAMSREIRFPNPRIFLGKTDRGVCVSRRGAKIQSKAIQFRRPADAQGQKKFWVAISGPRSKSAQNTHQKNNSDDITRFPPERKKSKS